MCTKNQTSFMGRVFNKFIKYANSRQLQRLAGISDFWLKEGFSTGSQLQVFWFARRACRCWRLVAVLWRHVRVRFGNRGYAVSVLWHKESLRFRSSIAWRLEAPVPFWLVRFDQLLQVLNPAADPLKQPLGEPKQVREATL